MPNHSPSRRSFLRLGGLKKAQTPSKEDNLIAHIPKEDQQDAMDSILESMNSSFELEIEDEIKNPTQDNQEANRMIAKINILECMAYHHTICQICKESPIPIALDEELIGINDSRKKEKLLEQIKPSFIVLKPTLHGGLKSTIEWIKLAQSYGIGYWITSALESSIGLNVIAQFTGSLNLSNHQGLGTGQLFDDNLDFPALKLNGEQMTFDSSALDKVNLKEFLS